MSKLSELFRVPHISENPTFDAEGHTLFTYKIWNGTKCLCAAVRYKSMDNASDRKHVRRVANEMLRLCDEAEK